MDPLKKVLYANTFCAYRDKYQNRILCRHKYSYGYCDLDLCPILNERYANIIFQPEGVVLIVKEPSNEYIAGVWKKHIIEISQDLDDEEQIIETCLEKANGIPEKIKDALIMRIKHIYQRWRFLTEKGKPVPIIKKEEAIREEPIVEELAREIERIEEEPKEEELLKELEKIESE